MGGSAVRYGQSGSMDSELGQLREEVLTLLAEDDVPVQEIWWAANSLFPEAALSTRLALAEQLVRDLVGDGGASVYRTSWLAEDGAASSGVGEAELEEVLRAWSTWITSEDAVLLSVRSIPTHRQG